MNVLSAALRQTAADLDRHKRTWALVGGFAVSARAEPRFTRGVDIAVAVEGDADSEDLVRSLLSDGYKLFATVEQDSAGRLATVRPQDLADLRALCAAATSEDLVAARDAARLITERGFNRGRDLLAAFEDITAS